MKATLRPETSGGLQFFADRFNIDAAVCDQLLREALSRGGDYADLYFEHTHQGSMRFEEGVLRTSSTGVLQGAGIRVVLGEAIGYAYTERFDLASMLEAARVAANIAAGTAGSASGPTPVRGVAVANHYPVEAFSTEAAAAAKVDLLRRANDAALAVAPSIERVDCSIREQVKHVAVATSEGCLVGDTQPLVMLGAVALSLRGSDRQSGYQGKSGRAGLDFFAADERTPEAIGRRAAELAVSLHDAVEAPAGLLPVVLAAGESGILLHEAVGHGLEADFNRKRTSNYADRIGQPVASPLCTVIDDGTVPGSRGSINIDDEGQQPQHNVLIEGGVLRGYLHDWISARHFRVPPSGSGRRESFRHYPMPRMTNTYMLPGESEPEEIIRSVKRGVLCKNFSGGQVNISNGDYVFSTTEAYLIEDGRVIAPIRTTTLIGNGPDSLRRVTMAGNDLRLSEGTWTCGKNGQMVPVSLGLPTVLVDGITVGGTKQ